MTRNGLPSASQLNKRTKTKKKDEKNIHEWYSSLLLSPDNEIEHIFHIKLTRIWKFMTQFKQRIALKWMRQKWQIDYKSAQSAIATAFFFSLAMCNSIPNDLQPLHNSLEERQTNEPGTYKYWINRRFSIQWDCFYQCHRVLFLHF